jgi:hypothetical protein
MIRPTWTLVVFEELEIIGRYEFLTFDAANTRAQKLQTVFDRYGISATARTIPRVALTHPTTQRAFPAAKRA